MSSGVAVVTGAGSGIGREITLALLAEGYRVALMGRTPATLEETASLSTRSRQEPLIVVADVAEEVDVTRGFDLVSRRWDRVDLLVNNAGSFGPHVEFDEIDLEGWQRTVDVNLTGAFLCARAAVRQMKRQEPGGGRVINVGSVSAHVPRPHSAAYTVTKHALTGLTKSIALDGRAHGIACGQIDIGNAATDMTAGLARAARQADGSSRPEPVFDPRHVAETVLNMARLPTSVNVPSVTILATGMPYVGRG